MRKNVTRSTGISANYDRVFDFLADVNNMPRWTVFAKKVWPEAETFKAETPQGEAEVWIKHARELGEIDFYWKIGDVEDFAESRLKKSNGQITYEFTIQEPPNAPEGTIDQLSKVVDEELSMLKDIAENELT